MNTFNQFQAILLTAAIFTLVPPVPSEAFEVYIRPTQTLEFTCPEGKQCITLEDLANRTMYFLNDKDNVSLIFLDGIHSTQEQGLEISNLEVLTISGPSHGNNSVQAIVKVHTISITNVSVLTVEDVSFSKANATPPLAGMVREMPGSIIVTAVNTIQLQRSTYSEIVFKASIGQTPFDVNTTITKLIIEDCQLDNGSFDIDSDSTETMDGELRSLDVNGGTILFQISSAGGNLVFENFHLYHSPVGLLVQADPLIGSIQLGFYDSNIENNLNGISVTMGELGQPMSFFPTAILQTMAKGLVCTTLLQMST